MQMITKHGESNEIENELCIQTNDGSGWNEGLRCKDRFLAWATARTLCEKHKEVRMLLIVKSTFDGDFGRIQTTTRSLIWDNSDGFIERGEVSE